MDTLLTRETLKAEMAGTYDVSGGVSCTAIVASNDPYCPFLHSPVLWAGHLLIHPMPLRQCLLASNLKYKRPLQIRVIAYLMRKRNARHSRWRSNSMTHLQPSRQDSSRAPSIVSSLIF